MDRFNGIFFSGFFFYQFHFQQQVFKSFYLNEEKNNKICVVSMKFKCYKSRNCCSMWFYFMRLKKTYVHRLILISWKWKYVRKDLTVWHLQKQAKSLIRKKCSEKLQFLLCVSPIDTYKTIEKIDGHIKFGLCNLRIAYVRGLSIHCC